MLHRFLSRRALRFGGPILAVIVGGALAVTLGSASSVASARDQLVNDSAKLAAVSPTIPAKLSCSGIASLTTLAALPSFPTAISSATVVPAANGNPAYCNVLGMIAPQTHFQLELPISTWQGRYLQDGCGGYCGSLTSQQFPSCDAQLGGDFAMATDDEGHTTESGLGGAGLFAFNDQTLRDEYGYLSEHALAVVAKTIITDYYGVPPAYSYFDGCSDGGREALSEAERYPDDFNGIIAGAPEIIAGPLNAEEQTWQYRVNTDANGNAILTSAQLPALHAAVIKACAGDDGTNDGIITDPRSCHFNPASIECPAGTQSNSCLTAAQVQVADDIYHGVETANGLRLYPGGLPYGSELAWAGFVVPVEPAGGGPVSSQAAAVYSGLSEPYLRYQLLPVGQLGPDPSEWNFNVASFKEMFPTANTYDAMSTDLRAFRAHGGKLLIWQGWADQAIPPFGTVDYYDTLVQRTGGLRATAQFARLFLFPTVYHCGGGYANSSFDVVLPMVQWVEQGVAPKQIIATDTIAGTGTAGGTGGTGVSGTSGDTGGTGATGGTGGTGTSGSTGTSGGTGTTGPTPTTTTVTRPVYPYPLIPSYNGSGPAGEASSFHPVVSPDASDYTQWIGNYLFYQPVSQNPTS